MVSSSFKIHLWRPAAVLRAKGTEAHAFLQGQFSNDLKGVAAGSAVYGLWLNQKGKVHADSFISGGETPGEFWITSYFSPAADIRERLESHIIADDVVVEDETAAFHGVALMGEGAITGAPALKADIVFPGRRGIGGVIECLARVHLSVAGATVLSDAEMELARIRAGVAAVPADIGAGELPNEGGLQVGAISYTKGCYLGQEVMARLKSMGKVRRRLCRVSGSGPAPARGAKLFQGGQAVGEMRTSATDGGGFVGMALLTLLQLKAGAGLGVVAGGPAGMELLDSP